MRGTSAADKWACSFNFPLEIGALQLMGALFMGNKPLMHVDHRCSLPL